MLIIKKYGGSSVSTPEKILTIAKRLKKLHDQGHKLVVIVSAMGDTTDELVQLSRRITHTPLQREMDMLLSSGERISMALMAIALNSLGCHAISFTGSQSGLFTDASHNNARIIDIKAFRVEAELEKGNIVIIAGFQGVNPDTKEVTTLGRGGSDTTAVAMAAHFKADRCDILTDVRGIFSVDPRIAGTSPRAISKLDYHSCLEMTYWGARVLHYRSVELAERSGVPILVSLSSEEGSGTLVESMEETEIRAVNYNSSVAALRFGKDFTLQSALEAVHEGLNHGGHTPPQIIYQRIHSHGPEFFISAPEELFDGIFSSINAWCSQNGKTKPHMQTDWATVTLTGRGLVNSDIVFKAAGLLKTGKIEPEALITTPLSVTFVVPKAVIQKAAQELHEEFVI